MATRRAGVCQYPGGCNRKTYDRFCWQHVGAAPRTEAPTGGADPRAGFGAPPRTDGTERMFTSVAECWDAISRVFPDIGDHVRSDDVRSQVVATARAAVSVEVYRKFPVLDVPDEATRDRYAAMMRTEMVEDMTPRVIDMDLQQAEETARSSVDRFGRGMDDSAGMMSYGLRCEWELANLLHDKVDRDGVPYRIPFDHFAARVAPSIAREVDDEFSRDLYRFPKIVHEVTRQEPLLPGAPAGAKPPERPSLRDTYQDEVEVYGKIEQARLQAEEERLEARREKIAKVVDGVQSYMDAAPERRRARKDAEARREQERLVREDRRRAQETNEMLKNLEKDRKRREEARKARRSSFW